MIDKNIQWPDIILLNGTSSAGKSTLASALQETFLHPYLILGFDDFVMSMPKRYWQSAATLKQGSLSEFNKQGVEMMEVQKKGEPVKVEAVFGEVFQRLIAAMPAVIATLAKTGNSVIFDYVYHDQAMYDNCQRCLKGFNVLHVGVFCPLDIVEKREQARGDRVLGRARGLYDVTHRFGNYDVSVDTSALSVEEAIATIFQAIKNRSSTESS